MRYVVSLMLCVLLTGCSSQVAIKKDLMIVDYLDNASSHKGLAPRIVAGLALLNEDSVRNAAPGKYEVDGENLYYSVSEYETKPFEDGRPEVHHKYLDIQYIVSGAECIGVAPLEGLVEKVPYNADRDVARYQNDSSVSCLAMKQGMFAIFWPTQPHMPGRSVGDSPEKVKKIVVKVRME